MTTKKTWKIKIIESFTKSWWKYVIFVIVLTIGFTGFQCEWGKVKVKKDPIDMPWKSKTTQGVIK